MNLSVTFWGMPQEARTEPWPHRVVRELIEAMVSQEGQTLFETSGLMFILLDKCRTMRHLNHERLFYFASRQATQG